MPTSSPGSPPSLVAPEEGLAALLVDVAPYFEPPKTPKAPKAPKLRQPGRAHDLIRKGVPQADLNVGGTLAVYNALVSTAMAFGQAGPPLLWEDWYGYLISPESRLGQQARLDKRRDIGKTRHDRLLKRAWDQARANIEKDPPFTHGDVEARAVDLLDEVAAAPWSATRFPDDKIVYEYAISEAERRGHTRPVLPIRAVSEATGVPVRTCARSLHRLVDAGLLRRQTRGQRTRRPEHRIGVLDTAAPGESVGSGLAGIYTIEALLRPSRQAVARWVSKVAHKVYGKWHIRPEGHWPVSVACPVVILSTEGKYAPEGKAHE